MIHVKCFTNGYVTTGHADYAEHGRDIVCASVSAISQATLGGLLYYTDASHIMIDGYLSVSTENVNAEASALLKTFSLAMQMLSKQYPEHIKYEKVEEENVHE